MERILVTFSGGVDSTTVLYHAINMLGIERVEAVSFDYGSKHNKRELEFAKNTANKLGVKHKIIELDFNKWGFKSDLLTV